MKKTLSIFIGFLLVFMLAACNQTAKPVENTENGSESTNENEKKNNEDNNDGKTSELTLEDVLTKSTEASEDLKSFAMTMEMNQELTSAQADTALKLSSLIDMKIVTDPMAFYQKMKMTDDASKESFDMESYFSKDGMYLYDSAADAWMKFPAELSDQLIQMSDQQTNPAEELKKLKEFVNDFTFEQDETSYILKLTASGEKFNTFIQETVQQTLPPQLGATNEITENMSINAIEYEIVVHKETFLPSSIKVMMEMDISAEGETIKIVQHMNGQYSEYNEIDEITIPQEVLDTAEEIEM